MKKETLTRIATYFYEIFSLKIALFAEISAVSVKTEEESLRFMRSSAVKLAIPATKLCNSRVNDILNGSDTKSGTPDSANDLQISTE